MLPGISVVIPVFNGARYLAECIHSVLDQTVPAQAILIIDDGSTDATPEVASSFGTNVRYERVPHGGLPYARNQGLRQVETDLVAFIDSDDLWLPSKLELQILELGRTTEPALIFGHLEQFVSSDLSPEEASEIRYDAAPLPGWLGSTLLMPTRVWQSVGPFDETIRAGEFIEWCSRVRDAGISSKMLPETVCRRRLHRTNMSRNKASEHGDYALMVKRVLDRRRAASAGNCNQR